VAGLEGSTHNTDVASAVEGVVATTVSHLNQVLLDGLALELGGVNEVSSTELASPLLLAIVNIDSNDLASLVLDSALQNRETDTADTKDSDVGALLDLGGLDSGTVTGGDTAAKKTGPVGRDLRSDSNDGDIGDDCVLREGGGTHEVEEVLAAGPEAGGAIRHDTLTLSGTDLPTEVSLAGLAELAFAAFGSATGMISWSSGRRRDRGVHTRAR
jgi:hypothetical protein